MTACSALRQLNLATGKKESLPVPSISLRDEGLWADVRLERWGFSPSGCSELGETQLLSHFIMLCRSGAIRSEVNWRGDGTQRALLQPGDVAMVPAGRRYSGLWTCEHPSLQNSVALIVAPALLQRIANEMGAIEVVLRPFVTLNDPFIANAILALEVDVRQQSPLGPIYGEAVASALATHLVRDCAERRCRPIKTGELSTEVARRMRDYIDAHLGEPILLSHLASVGGTEIYRIARAFKKTFGVSPHRYIINARVHLAKALLREGDQRLVDIAFQTGFASQSHFTTVFSKWAGMSPAKYRESVQ